MPLPISTAPQGYTNMQKAAAVMIALGAQEAAAIYKFLRDEEVEQLTIEIAKMNRLPPEEMKAIADDFYGLCVAQKVIAEGGVDYARSVLEKAFGTQQAVSYMERVTKSLKTKAFDFIRKADYKSLLNILQNEHPQTIALILSYARADQASQVIGELPPDLRIEVIERIAKLDRASPEMINIVERILAKKFGSIISVDLMELGGVRHVADIMNNVDRGTEKQIFDELGLKDPELADNVRKLMFVFEDIIFLDNMSRIWQSHSRAPIRMLPMLSSAICPSVCRRPLPATSNTCITFVCVMLRQHSRISLILSASLRKTVNWSSPRAERMM